MISSSKVHAREDSPPFKRSKVIIGIKEINQFPHDVKSNVYSLFTDTSFNSQLVFILGGMRGETMIVTSRSHIDTN